MCWYYNIDAVKKSKYNASNDDEIITSIAKWLTSAKGRIEGKWYI